MFRRDAFPSSRWLRSRAEGKAEEREVEGKGKAI